MLEESGVRVHAQGLTGDIAGRGWGEEEEEEGGYGESRHEQGWMVSIEEGRDGIFHESSIPEEAASIHSFEGPSPPTTPSMKGQKVSLLPLLHPTTGGAFPLPRWEGKKALDTQ